MCVCVSVIISAACCSHLLSHEIQPALQGVGDFNLAIAVVDLHASGTVSMRLKIYIYINQEGVTGLHHCSSFASEKMLTCLGRGSCPGRCGPPGWSSRLLCRSGRFSGWKPEKHHKGCFYFVFFQLWVGLNCTVI